MADWYAGTDDSASRAAIHLAMWESSTDPANNRSLVSYYLDIYDNNGSYGGYGTGSWSATIAGVGYSGSLSYDFTGNSGASYRVVSNSTWVTHNGDGTGGASATAWFGGSSPVGNAGIGTVSIGLTDFFRPPGAPDIASLSRTSDGSKITMTATVPSSPLTITNYYFRYSTDNSNWYGVGYTGSSATTFSNWSVPSSTVGYYISAQAANSDGWGSAGNSTFIAGVPTAPTVTSAIRTGRNVTVTIGGSSSNGGATITAYKIQASSDNGATWGTVQDITSGTYTYTGLTPALTWLFRVYAINSTGNSAYATSAGVFVPAGGKLYNTNTAGAWANANIARRNDGAGWVELSTAKRFDGTNWVDLS